MLGVINKEIQVTFKHIVCNFKFNHFMLRVIIH